MTYLWAIGSKTLKTKEPVLTYTFKEAGEYKVSVEVRDNEKASSKSNEITVYAGNEQPKVSINLQGNRSFYFSGKPVRYEVKVTDNGDKVDMKNLFVSSNYLQSNEDPAAQGDQFVPDEIMGKNLTLSLDCKSCHKEQEKVVGPAFAMVAQKYRRNPKASSYLIQKIMKGGSGVWGEVPMPPHQTIKESDLKQIVQYVLSLEKGAKNKSLSSAGTIFPNSPVANTQNTAFTLTASYTDLGGARVKPLTGSERILLRNSSIDVGDVKTILGFNLKDSSGSKYLILPTNEGSLKIQHVDLTDIKSIELIGSGYGQVAKYHVEIRTDALNGNMIG